MAPQNQVTLQNELEEATQSMNLKITMKKDEKRFSRETMMREGGEKVDLKDWGYPGFLTEAEFTTFVSTLFLPNFCLLFIRWMSVPRFSRPIYFYQYQTNRKYLCKR